MLVYSYTNNFYALPGVIRGFIQEHINMDDNM